MVSTSRVGRCGLLFMRIKVSFPSLCKPALHRYILYTALFIAIKCKLLFLLFLPSTGASIHEELFHHFVLIFPAVCQ